MIGNQLTSTTPPPMYVSDVEMIPLKRSARPPLVAIWNSSVAAELTELWLVEDWRCLLSIDARCRQGLLEKPSHLLIGWVRFDASQQLPSRLISSKADCQPTWRCAIADVLPALAAYAFRDDRQRQSSPKASAPHHSSALLALSAGCSDPVEAGQTHSEVAEAISDLVRHEATRHCARAQAPRARTTTNTSCATTNASRTTNTPAMHDHSHASEAIGHASWRIQLTRSMISWSPADHVIIQQHNFSFYFFYNQLCTTKTTKALFNKRSRPTLDLLDRKLWLNNNWERENKLRASHELEFTERDKFFDLSQVITRLEKRS